MIYKRNKNIVNYGFVLFYFREMEFFAHFTTVSRETRDSNYK